MECEKVVVIGIYKKNSGKVCSITNSLRSQTKVWKLTTLSIYSTPIITSQRVLVYYISFRSYAPSQHFFRKPTTPSMPYINNIVFIDALDLPPNVFLSTSRLSEFKWNY